MPELPEVETIARTLRPELVGRTILDADLLWPRTLAHPSPARFRKQIRGLKISAVRRRAKYFHIQLTPPMDQQGQPLNLFIHLRMSGDLYIQGIDAPKEKHDRLILTLGPLHSGKGEDPEGNRKKLIFNDARKFGRVWLVQQSDQVIGGLGPEPLDESFTAQSLYESLHARRRQLKPLLLDQSFLAGLGNIYADEALFKAHLHPLATSNSISKEQAGELWEAIRAVLWEGIRRNGASIDWVYRGGQFQNAFFVYGRDTQACRVCGTAIQRIIVGQRGTHFCPSCQLRE